MNNNKEQTNQIEAAPCCKGKKVTALRILSATLLSILLLSGCSNKESVGDVSDSIAGNAPNNSISSANSDTNDGTDGSHPLSSQTGVKADIILNGDNAAYNSASTMGDTSSREGTSTIDSTPNGDGISFSNGVLTLTQAGDYTLSGTLNGQILVDASSEDQVHLTLNGVTIENTTGAAIVGNQSDQLSITLAEDTVNTISDGSEYLFTEEGATEPNAAIFSKDDLSFQGNGTLIINGNYGDGIRSKDDLEFWSGTYEITAVSDTIQGKDSVTIHDGQFTLSAGKDTIKSSNSEESDKGGVTINGGTFSLEAGDDAIHAENALIINDGTLDITSCYEGLEGLTVEINGGDIRLNAADDGVNAAGGSDSGEAFFGGGMENGNSEASITLNGGILHINSEGDGMDSNGALIVNDGELYIDGPSSDGNGALDYSIAAQINGGVVVAAGASGMATGFQSESSQCSILYNFPEWTEAGTEIILTDNAGNELLRYAPEKSYNSVVLSTSQLEIGKTYTLTCGSQSTEITLEENTYANGQGGFGGMPGHPGRGERPEMGEHPEMGEMPDMKKPARAQ